MALRTSTPEPPDDNDVLTDVVMTPSNESEALARPSNVGKFYVENQNEIMAEAQVDKFARAGVMAASPDLQTASGTSIEFKSAKAALERKEKAEEAKQSKYDFFQDKMADYIDRPTYWKKLYVFRLLLLFFGDVAGVAGASLLLGESLENAFGVALAAAMAAITLGALGKEAKIMVMVRQRAHAADQLPDDYEPLIPKWFSGKHEGERIVKMMFALIGLGLVVLAFAIWFLRDTTEGSAAGWTFGCIALVLGLASFANSFDSASDVGDALDQMFKHLCIAEQQRKAAAAHPALAIHNAALQSAADITTAHKHAGEAARKDFLAHIFTIFRNNPHIVGHGTAVTVPAQRTEVIDLRDTDTTVPDSVPKSWANAEPETDA